MTVVSICLPSDALSQRLPSYLGFSYLGRVSLQGCSSKAQPLLLTLDMGYLLTAAAPDLGRGVDPFGRCSWPWNWGNSSRCSCAAQLPPLRAQPHLSNSLIRTNLPVTAHWAWGLTDCGPWAESGQAYISVQPQELLSGCSYFSVLESQMGHLPLVVPPLLPTGFLIGSQHSPLSRLHSWLCCREELILPQLSHPGELVGTVTCFSCICSYNHTLWTDCLRGPCPSV